jgi:hypothetical protein
MDQYVSTPPDGLEFKIDLYDVDEILTINGVGDIDLIKEFLGNHTDISDIKYVYENWGLLNALGGGMLLGQTLHFNHKCEVVSCPCGCLFSMKRLQ